MATRMVLCLAAVYLIWSSTFRAMAIAVRELPPLLMASLRYSPAGLVMLAVARRRGAAWPSVRQWVTVIPIGALLFIGGNGFIAVGEQTVASSGAAVVCATMPLWAAVLSALSGERPSRREWLALVIGFVGVVVLLGGPSLAGKPWHIVLVLASPPCWALGSSLARRAGKAAASHDTFMSSAMQMITGGVALAVSGVVLGERLPTHASAQTWLAVAYLAVFGSLIAFTAYNWLLRHARPVVATSYAYVNPVLAVALGAAASEQVGVSTVIAIVLIIGAVALVLVKPRTR
ncbi:MAG TPA: drug/metabolite exporter YedA [Kofleriaceae bacterium]|nr:drug/metabolite exporter YedA [Kofleriaceae bacterium]